MAEKKNKKETPSKSNKIDKQDSKIVDLEAKVEELQKLLGEQEEKVATINDRYVRLVAEFDNYRRRTSKEKLELVNTAGEDIIKGLLPILDDCERGLKVLKESGADSSAITGTELILNKLFGYLKTKGVELIEAMGEELNTDFHEAIAQFPIEEAEKKNKIIDVVQNGYTLHSKVIRYAKVVVGV